MNADKLLNHILSLPAVKAALNQQIYDLAEGIVEREVDRAHIDRQAEDAVQDAVDEMDLARDAERAVEDAVGDIDWDERVKETIEGIDLDEAIETSLRNVLGNLVISLQPIHEGKQGTFRLVIEEE